jgi:hypothetical protein
MVFVIMNMAALAHAGNILYYVDGTQSSDQMLAALDYYAAAGIHTYTKLTNVQDYGSELQSGAYDLGILMVQQTQSSTTEVTSAINALGQFVDDGGLSIYTDWSRNDSLASLFDVEWQGGSIYESGNKNYQSMDITYADFALGMSGQVDFTDQGWSNYNLAMTPLEGGTSAAAYRVNGEPSDITAIALGNDGRSITNGMMNDTFEDPEQGEQLYINEIGYLLPPHAPEPSTLLLFGTGAVGFFIRRRKI